MSQNSSLIIKTKICSKDNYELLDYDSSDIMINRLNINKSGILIRSEKDTFFVDNSESIEKKDIELLKIIKDVQKDCYFINTTENPNDLDKLLEQKCSYIVYKNPFFEEEKEKNDKRFYKLSEGDVLKLGKVFIRILRINLTKNNLKDNSRNNNYNFLNNKKDFNFTSIVRNSSCSSLIIKGQEVIKGSCGSLGLNYNNNEDDRQGELIILNKNKLKKNMNIKKQSLILPKVSSTKDLLTARTNKIKIKYKKKFNNLFINKFENNHQIKKSNENNKKICRICFQEEEKIDMENPLINPCTCKGSMKYIHYKCLKNWLESKIRSSPLSSVELEDKIGMCYCTNDLICELCKTKFPDYINYNGKLFNLIFYDTNFEKYLIFESKQIEEEKRFIHILSFDKTNKIIIGRSKECDISFPEISVSRYHCYIHYNNKKEELYLEDNSSRFGSLVLVQNPFLLMIDQLPLKIQTNKTFIKIKLSIPFNFFSCCSVKYDIYKKYKSYQEQNEPFLDICNILEIKNNDDNEESEEIIYNENNNEKDINEKNNRNVSPIKLVGNNSNNTSKNESLFFLRLKSIDSTKKKKINKGRFERILNKNTSNEQYTKLIETQRLLSGNKKTKNSLGKDNEIHLNRLNLNKNNIYIGNLNIFSLKSNNHKNSSNSIYSRKEEKNDIKDEDKKNE